MNAQSETKTGILTSSLDLDPLLCLAELGCSVVIVRALFMASEVDEWQIAMDPKKCLDFCGESSHWDENLQKVRREG